MPKFSTEYSRVNGLSDRFHRHRFTMRALRMVRCTDIHAVHRHAHFRIDVR